MVGNLGSRSGRVGGAGSPRQAHGGEDQSGPGRRPGRGVEEVPRLYPGLQQGKDPGFIAQLLWRQHNWQLHVFHRRRP